MMKNCIKTLKVIKKTNYFKSENLVREVFHHVFNFKFPKKRLKELNNLELDGYCKDLNLAFEYQGLHHYQVVKYLKKYSESDLIKTKEKDLFKLNKCKELNIKLFIIDAIPNITYDYVLNEVKNQSLNLNLNINQLNFNPIQKIKKQRVKKPKPLTLKEKKEKYLSEYEIVKIGKIRYTVKRIKN